MQEKETDRRERCFFSALPSLHPLQESQEVRRVRVRPATTKRQGVFLTVAHINNKHTHLSHTPQNNSLCVLFHQEVRPDHQTLGLPAEQRKKSCTPFSYGNTLLKKKQHYEIWRSEVCYECGRRGTLGPDCPGMPLAPSDPGRPCKNNNSYVTRLLTDHCKHAMKARRRPAF